VPRGQGRASVRRTRARLPSPTSGLPRISSKPPRLGLPAFPEGLLVGANYAASFFAGRRRPRLNLGVSFALALRVALQAYDVPAREQWPLLQTCGRRFLKSPGEFLLPPRRNR